MQNKYEQVMQGHTGHKEVFGNHTARNKGNIILSKVTHTVEQAEARVTLRDDQIAGEDHTLSCSLRPPSFAWLTVISLSLHAS